MTDMLEKGQRSPLIFVDGDTQGPRWAEGERLEHLFEERCEALRKAGRSERLAVDAATSITYDDLDLRANQLARYLIAQGLRCGDRVGLLFDDAATSYVALLAVLKAHAAYVPLDPSFPSDRLQFIATDADVRLVLTLSHLAAPLAGVSAGHLCLDQVQEELRSFSSARLTTEETGVPTDELCYIIYTSGSTGRPKGVAIEHPSICNFVRVAAETYGYRSSDRVYQGMTLAFDFSVEEIWVPLLVGATLVPKPTGSTLLGGDLQQYLRANRITALCCVPTLLATLEDDLPDLRFLLVSGEACPQDLVRRWHRPNRRFLNVYGPTETTVTATWAVLEPDRPVTLGVPLPTYTALILDPSAPAALGRGELGEIAIAGVGLAAGYVNRDDLTARAFIPDFLHIENNPSSRIYRTGDLGRINETGEIEYHGRIDTQVKIRGYRIELSEIESVLLHAPGIAQAVVNTHESEPGLVELAAYYTRRPGSDPVDSTGLVARLRDQLPPYMVPAYYQELDSIPMLASDKADRKSLPVPTARHALSTTSKYTAPSNEYERALAGVVADVMHLPQVSVDAHLFDDLGANSLLMAHISARVSADTDLPPLTIRTLYQHPTVARLAHYLQDGPRQSETPRQVLQVRPRLLRGRTRKYLTCGALQLITFLAYSLGLAQIVVSSYSWLAAADDLGTLWTRSIVISVLTFLAMTILPVLTKWLLIGRWKVEQIPLWSLRYFRFWLVKTLITVNPMMLFVGSPLYTAYLRLLGARIGSGVLVLASTPPTCTDLIQIGPNTVIGKDVRFQGYRAVAGHIQTGQVTIGSDAFVGPASVLDIDTSLGDGSQLGHASSLHPSQSIPAGERWHGVPARPTATNFLRVAPRPSSAFRRGFFPAAQLFTRLVIVVPLVLLVLESLAPRILLRTHLELTLWELVVDTLLISVVLYIGGLALALIFVVTVPRLLAKGLRQEVVYPLYGFRYYQQRLLARVTNVAVFGNLFGDSSLIIHYLRVLGYDVSRPIVQTGSNFGAEVTHDSPYLCTIGRGTMVSDGLSMINAEFSHSTFRMARVKIGATSFFGNGVVYPSGAAVGDNCLFATKTMVPIDGAPREGVGLLGSPAFEIPRSVRRDGQFFEAPSGDALGAQLSAKLRHNITSMVLYLAARWFHVAFTLLIFTLSANYYGIGVVAVAITTVVILLLTVAYLVLVERAAQGFRRLQPQFCSIYDIIFWRHERFWKLIAPPIIMMFAGTPYLNLVMRLSGVRLGKRVFNDGCFLPEKSLVSIGNDCTLNAGSVIQCHSMEDGAFKLEPITIDEGVTLGVAAYVHYAAHLSANSVVEADSFVMKGTELEPETLWSGNPANLVGTVAPERAALSSL